MTHQFIGRISSFSTELCFPLPRILRNVVVAFAKPFRLVAMQGNEQSFNSTLCCSLRRGVAAGSRRRGRDSTPAAWTGDADADAERAPGRAPDSVAANIGAHDRGVSAERLRAARLAPVGRRSPRSHLHAVRGLRQLRRPGRLAFAHRVRHC